MSEGIARQWADGADPPPSDAMVAEQVALEFRSADWSKVQEAAKRPTTIMYGRLYR